MQKIGKLHQSCVPIQRWHVMYYFPIKILQDYASNARSFPTNEH